MVKQWQRQPYARIREGGRDAPYKEIRVVNPARGLNLLIADILANDKEATAGSRNLEYVEGGAPRKRMGYLRQGTGLTNAPRGLGQFISEDDNYPITADGDTLKKLESGSWNALSGVTVDATANISITNIFEKTYAWDGVNGGVVYDGTTVARPGTMPRARFSVIYKGYHVASGVRGQPFRLYWSSVTNTSLFTNNVVPANPETIGINDAANVPGATVFSSSDATVRAIDINKDDGQDVVGLGFFQDVLIVFKENSIYQLYLNAEGGFVVERISSSYGAVCHGAIASVENDCYFLTDKGVYVLGNEPNYFASIRTNELSSRVKPLLERINPAQYERCRGFYFDDRYFLSIPLDDSDTCNAMVVYDRRFYAWMYWTNISAQDMYVFKDKDNDGAKHFYFTDYETAFVQEFIPGTYRDNDEAIDAIFITRAFEGKMIDREKYWYVIRPIFRLTTGAVTMSYITERGSEGQSVPINPTEIGGLGLDQFGALQFGTSQTDTYSDSDLGLPGSTGGESSSTDYTHTVYDIGVGLDSRTLKVKFENSGIDETFTLLGWAILYQEKDHARFDGASTIR
jgi:hypothetical protein